MIVRPFNHAGPRQSPRYVLAGLAFQVAQVEAGRSSRLEVGNLDVIRDFTDVRDVVRGYRLLAQAGQPGEVYNLEAARARESPTRSSTSGRWPRFRSKSTSIRPRSGRSINRCWSRTPRSFAQPSAGNRDTRFRRHWPTCSNAARKSQLTTESCRVLRPAPQPRHSRTRLL